MLYFYINGDLNSISIRSLLQLPAKNNRKKEVYNAYFFLADTLLEYLKLPKSPTTFVTCVLYLA